MPKVMVAVPGTQAGAKKNRFNDDRYLAEVIWPVKNFLESTQRTCPVLLFFFAGTGENSEEALPVLLREQNEGRATPSYFAAEKHFPVEIRQKLVHLVTITEDEASNFDEVLRQLMTDWGVEHPRILAPQNLGDLVVELTAVAT